MGRRDTDFTLSSIDHRLDHPGGEIIRKCWGRDRRHTIVIRREVREPIGSITKYSSLLLAESSLLSFSCPSLLTERDVLHFEFLDEIEERGIRDNSEVSLHIIEIGKWIFQWIPRKGEETLIDDGETSIRERDSLSIRILHHD